MADLAAAAKPTANGAVTAAVILEPNPVSLDPMFPVAVANFDAPFDTLVQPSLCSAISLRKAAIRFSFCAAAAAVRLYCDAALACSFVARLISSCDAVSLLLSLSTAFEFSSYCSRCL